MGTYSAPVWNTSPPPPPSEAPPADSYLQGTAYTLILVLVYFVKTSSHNGLISTKSPHFTRERHSLVLTKHINKNTDTLTHIWRKKTLLPSHPHLNCTHYILDTLHATVSLHTKQQRLGRSDWRFGEHSVHFVILDFLLKWGQLGQEVGDNCQAGFSCQTNHCLGGQTTFLL